MKIKLPIKTVSEANGHKKAIKKNGIIKYKNEHWSETAKRHRVQKEAVKMACINKITPDMLPCKIKLTRIAPRFLDSVENLPMSLKWVIDSICELLVPNKAIGQADSDKRIQITCDQIKGIPHEYAIEIEIMCGKCDVLESQV
jgi:hypothetical protein